MNTHLKLTFTQKNESDQKVRNLGEGHIENDNIFDDKLLDKLLPYSNEILSLTRKMVIDFVDEILVDNNKSIRIKFRFADELKKYHSIFE